MGRQIADERPAQHQNELRFHDLQRGGLAVVPDPLEIELVQIAARDDGVIRQKVVGDPRTRQVEQGMASGAVQRLLLLQDRPIA